MRKCFILLSGLLALIACNNNKSASNIEAKPDSVAQVVDYPYSPKDKPNWEMGDPNHIAIVLNALKNYEAGKIDELSKYFADSVWFGSDGLEFNGTRDSLLKMFKKEWANMKSTSVEMHDWESVHGKDNKEDWVSLWYKMKWTTNDGKTDSAMFMDDAKIVDGKIRVLDSKRRRFPTKK